MQSKRTPASVIALGGGLAALAVVLGLLPGALTEYITGIVAGVL